MDEEADQQGGGHRAPATLADVAEVAGVSRQTVSNAINNPDIVSPDTLVRVRRAIDELGYTPNHAARQLRTRSSQLIGLRLMPSREFTTIVAMDRFVRALVAAAQDVGYNVLLFSGGSVEDDEQSDPLGGYDDLLRSTAVDAFVVTDTYLGNDQMAGLALRKAPFVAFGRPWDNPSATHPWIDVDGRAGVRAAVDHVHALGHERIAFLGWQPGSRLGDDRRAGFQEAVAAHGLAGSVTDLSVADTVGAGRGAAADLLAAGTATAFVCASDPLALGVLQSVAEHGLLAGRDIAIVGFDDSPAGRMMGLTSVRQPVEEVARGLIEMLVDLVGSGRRPDQPDLLEPTLVVRSSTDPDAQGRTPRSENA